MYLVQDLLPNFRALTHVLNVNCIEREASRLELVIVTANTILVDESPLWGRC